MKSGWQTRLAIRFAPLSLGTLWLFGCVTDLQARDFFQSTAIRVFWQAIGTALQSAVVNTSSG